MKKNLTQVVENPFAVRIHRFHTNVKTLKFKLVNLLLEHNEL